MNLITEWNLYAVVKRFVPNYLQTAFLYSPKTLTIYQLQEALDWLDKPGFDYDEMQEAIQVYQQQFLQGTICLNQK